MGKKSRRARALSGKGRTRVATAEVDTTKPTITKEPSASGVSKNDAAVCTVRHYYDKLIQLPLDEKVPALFKHYLITASTLERVGKPCHIRAERNGFILQDVIETVQTKPDMLDVFCNLLQDFHVAAELAQLMKEKFEELKLVEQDARSASRVSLPKESEVHGKMFQNWWFVCILLGTIPVILLASYLAPQHVTGKAAEWQVRVPPIPAGFTGREEEMLRIVDCLNRDVRIVSITGGPGYGKSSVAIVSSHRLMEHNGIPVCYVSLTEADSMESFMLTLLHGLTMKADESPDKFQILRLVRMLTKKTVIVLDNADQLTLNQTELREDFIQLLKQIVAESDCIHFVVVTRYRFKITSAFEEIHLQPLPSPQALHLFRTLIDTPRHVSDHDEELTEEQLQVIANKTGGIPLAIKVVGQLVRSGDLPVAELLEELSIDPISTLSEDSFTSDEQLKHCIDLSYKYLSPAGQSCFLFAAMFPGSFDRKANKYIIANLTGNVYCLKQLVDRSLVEYSAVNKRYNVHVLLRAFAKDHSDARNLSLLENYYHLYAKHYIAVLTEQVKRAESHGNVSSLYTTLVLDYHNFLQLLDVLSTNLTSSPHKDQMELALVAFQILQARFPHKALLGWWTRLLEDVCFTTSSDHQTLAVQGLQLSIKLALLLSYNDNYQLARQTLLSAHMCIRRDESLIQSFESCQHPQLSIYMTLLQVLAKLSEKMEILNETRAYNESILKCLILNPAMEEVDEEFPHNYCSNVIAHLWPKYEKLKDFESGLQLFNALLKCKGAEAVKSIKLLEDVSERCLSELSGNVAAALRMAKCMCLVSNHEEEVKWLERSIEYMDSSIQGADKLVFYVSFRLTTLYWTILNDKQKALENAKAAYSIAMRLPLPEVLIWQASIKLADILNQIDGYQEEAAHYFQEALGRLPYADASPDFIYTYQHFIEMNLMSLHFQSGQFTAFVHHYGQWVKLEAEATARGSARLILDMYDKMRHAQLAKNSSLAIVDNSLDWQLKGWHTVWRYLKTRVAKTYESSVWYVHFALFCILGIIFCVVFCFYVFPCLLGCFCNVFCVVPVLFVISMLLVASIPVYSFHYFLYVAIVNRKVWKPNRLSAYPTTVLQLPAIKRLFAYQDCIVLSYLIHFYLLSRHSHVFQPNLYHNVSMNIIDDRIYSAIKLN